MVLEQRNSGIWGSLQASKTRESKPASKWYHTWEAETSWIVTNKSCFCMSYPQRLDEKASSAEGIPDPFDEGLPTSGASRAPTTIKNWTLAAHHENKVHGTGGT